MNILVTGANGQLGTELRGVAAQSGNHYVFSDVNAVPGRETVYLDITNIDAVRIINTAKDKKLALGKGDIDTLVQLFDDIVFGVLGLLPEEEESGKADKTIAGLMDMVLEQRAAAKAARDWTTSDHIRDALKALGISVKDTKEGAEWTLE